MKKCPSCGFDQSPDNSRFCIRCGAPLSNGQPATGDAQQSQSARPADAPMQRASAFPGAVPSAPGISRPSPYAALPHIPSSAKGRKTSPKKSRWPALLGGAGLIAVCICALFLFIQIGIGEGQSGGSPSPTSAPYTYRLGGDAYLCIISMAPSISTLPHASPRRLSPSSSTRAAIASLLLQEL